MIEESVITCPNCGTALSSPLKYLDQRLLRKFLGGVASISGL
jgi:hypothetical protein